MKKETALKLAALKKQMNTMSTKPLQRLLASVAAHEYNALAGSLPRLPGSARRGLARGKEIS